MKASIGFPDWLVARWLRIWGWRTGRRVSRLSSTNVNQNGRIPIKRFTSWFPEAPVPKIRANNCIKNLPVIHYQYESRLFFRCNSIEAFPLQETAVKLFGKRGVCCVTMETIFPFSPNPKSSVVTTSLILLRSICEKRIVASGYGCVLSCLMLRFTTGKWPKVKEDKI